MPVPEIVLSGDALAGIPVSEEHRRSALELPQAVKLGRIRPDPLLLTARRMLTAKLADYIDLGQVLKSLPAAVDYYTKAAASTSRMYLNDRYGDCVIAGKAHAHGAWTAADVGTAALATDQEIYATYQSWCGPGDNGCVITDVLDRCKSFGLPMNGTRHKIDGYADCDNRNKELTKAAVYLFGAVSIGINLPSAWTSAAVWDVTSTSIVGGHDVTILGYDDKGVYIASWGRIYLITWAAYQSTKWIEESWVILAPDWYNDDSLAPNGVNVAALKDAMGKIGGGVVPSVDPPTPPTPPIPPPAPDDSLVWLTTGLVPVIDGGGRVVGYTKAGKYPARVAPRTAAEPIPPDPPAVPQTFTVNVPQQTGTILGLPIVKLPPFVIQGTVGGSAFELTSADLSAVMGPGGSLVVTLPDWFAALLKQLCAWVPTSSLPGWTKAALGVLCGAVVQAPTGTTLVIPPALVWLLKLLCQFSPALPPPFNTVLSLLCGVVGKDPKPAPCPGCQ